MSVVDMHGRRPKLEPLRNPGCGRALAKGHRVTGRIASPEGAPAEATIRRRGRKAQRINPRDTDALYRADLMDRQWEGLGNWTGILTDAGRLALAQSAKEGGAPTSRPAGGQANG